MSSFVELAQELNRLALGGTGPVDVEVVAGMEARIVNYVKNSWIDIQTHPLAVQFKFDSHRDILLVWVDSG